MSPLENISQPSIILCQTSPDETHNKFSGMNVSLSLSDLPLLNTRVNVSFEVSPCYDAPNTTIQILIPDAFAFHSGDLAWNGNIPVNEIVKIESMIEAKVAGNFTIQAWAMSDQFGQSFGNGDTLYVTINETTATVSRSLEGQTSIGQVGTQLSPDSNTPPGNSLIIKGYFYFWSDETNSYQPIKYATVEVLDEEPWPLPAEHLAWGITDKSGYYYVNQNDYGNPIDNDDGWLQDGRDIYVIVYARNTAVEVIDFWLTNYACKTNTKYDVSDGTVDMGSYTAPGTDDGAYNIHNIVSDAWVYVANQPNTPSPGKVIVQWYPGFSPIGGTNYNPILNTIYLQGKDDDPDEWDVCVITHEYGHFIMDTFADEALMLNPLKSEDNWRWVEGWAQFFQAPVRDYYGYSDPEIYIDKKRTWTLSINIETWTTAVDRYNWVASILWDIYDGDITYAPTGQDDDTLHLGFDEIWDVFRNYDPSPSDPFHNHPQTIDEFWDGWFARAHDYRSEMNAIFWNHGIDKNNPPTVQVVFPNTWGWYRGTITVEASASDTDGRVRGVWFWYNLYTNDANDARWVYIGNDMDPSGGWKVAWDTSSLTDSSVWIKAVADDSMESSSPDVSDSHFGLDNTPPGVSASHSPTSPTDAESVSFTITASDDAQSGLSSVTLYWYDGSWRSQSRPMSGSTGSVVINVGKLAPGTIYYYATANDIVDNQGRDPSTGYKSFTVTDDDTTPPSLYNPVSSGDIYDWAGYDYLLQISASDSSGIYSVSFAYRFGSSPWSEWKPYAGQSGDAYRYYIPRSEWITHVGETIYWQAYAWDDDVDRPDDALGTSSPVYSGGTIYDDDTSGPSFSNPSSQYIEATGAFRIQTDVTDPSQIYTVQFRYRFAGGAWPSWQTYTGSTGDTYWYDIPYDTWSPYAGQTIYWQAYAEDNDNNRPGDRTSSQSIQYSASLPTIPGKVHNLDTGLDYATIQEAIDASETLDGHTIFVEQGTYYEHVVIHKSIKLVGENRETTIIDGEGTGWPVELWVGNVEISTLTIQNGLDGFNSPPNMGFPDDPTYSYGSSNNFIHDNTFINCFLVFYSDSSDNTISYNNGAAVIFYSACIRNEISHNHGCAVYFGWPVYTGGACDQNRVYNNTMMGDIFIGGSMGWASYLNIIENNTGDGYSISLLFADNNIIRRNKGASSIYIDRSDDNLIVENDFSGDIYIAYERYSSMGNTISYNNFGTGAFVTGPPEVELWKGANNWDHNYYGDYTGTDADGDGIGDQPYVVPHGPQDALNVDNYPLMQPWGGDIDGDGIPDSVELHTGTDPFDADTDDDGLMDGSAGGEDLNDNGVVDQGETDPRNPDSDGDGIQDGTERGLTEPEHPTHTNLAFFVADVDPSTTTDPLDPDTDNDGLSDGEEDINKNGKVDPGESDPNKPAGPTVPEFQISLVVINSIAVCIWLFVKSRQKRKKLED